jgi:hypothetical protein
MQQAFECLVNWRLAHRGFLSPTGFFEIDHTPVKYLSELILYIPREQYLDVTKLRDWLHDSDNNIAGYQMIGRYMPTQRGKVAFLGLKFAFIKPLDAVMFRLQWAEATIPNDV